MSWVLASIVAVGLVGFAWWMLRWSKKPYRHRNLSMDRFEWLIRSLLETTKDGSVLVIEHEGSDRFIQFVKHDLPSGNSVLGFGFPDAPWSRDYFDEMRAAFSEYGVDY